MAEFIPTGLGGLTSRPNARKSVGTGTSRNPETYTRAELLPPPRPMRGHVPGQEVIEALIERALLALKRGIIWDRGSIINLVL